MRFIGDVHGKFSGYKAIIKDCPASIQVGDMGVGFLRTHGPRVGEEYSNPPHYAMIRGNHRFIRGNHDSPEACARHSQWIPDGTIEDGTMFIGGALSIDKAFRIEGYSWWQDEELSSNELSNLVDKFIAEKPRVMITHECPEEIAIELVREIRNETKLDPRFASRTRQALQSMWSAHSPELWIFGHWHHSFDREIRGTRFICLTELEYMDLDL